jgi:hypothetical protein
MSWKAKLSCLTHIFKLTTVKLVWIKYHHFNSRISSYILLSIYWVQFFFSSYSYFPISPAILLPHDDHTTCIQLPSLVGFTYRWQPTPTVPHHPTNHSSEYILFLYPTWQIQPPLRHWHLAGGLRCSASYSHEARPRPLPRSRCF